MAQLIIGGTREQQQKLIEQIAQEINFNLQKSNPDLLIINPDNSIKIDQIRQIHNFLSKKSWQGQSQKLVVINQADLMTQPAQNAFLKTLEEPLANSHLILTAHNKTALIDTIISRCHIKNIQTEINVDINKRWEQWQKLIKKTKAQRLGSKQKFNDQDYQDFLITLQKKLINSDRPRKIHHWIKLIQKVRQMLSDNVQPDKVVDWLNLKI